MSELQAAIDELKAALVAEQAQSAKLQGILSGLKVQVTTLSGQVASLTAQLASSDVVTTDTLAQLKSIGDGIAGIIPDDLVADPAPAPDAPTEPPADPQADAPPEPPQ